MKDNFEYIDELIAKVLTNEATREEQAWLDSWVMESELNKVYLEDSKKLIDQVEKTREEISVDTNTAWNALNKRLSNKEARIVVLQSPKKNYQIAAAIILLVVMSFLIKVALNITDAKPKVFAAGSQAIETKLSDGTLVHINQNSEIAFIEKKGVRELKLKGEAYFEVVHKDEQPFVITVNNVLIKDIGTEFNVKSLQNGDVEVTVDGGEVQFYTKKDEGLKLIKGDKARYSVINDKFIRIDADIYDNTGSYHSRVFNFKNAQLQDVIDQINQIYRSDVRLSNPKLANCRVNSQFNNQSLEEIVAILADIFDLKIEKNGSVYVLIGEECPLL